MKVDLLCVLLQHYDRIRKIANLASTDLIRIILDRFQMQDIVFCLLILLFKQFQIPLYITDTPEVVTNLFYVSQSISPSSLGNFMNANQIALPRRFPNNGCTGKSFRTSTVLI